MPVRGHNTRMPWETEQAICALYQDGYAAEIVAGNFGFSKKTVLNVLRRNGIRRRDVHEARRQSKGDFLRYRPPEERFWERVEKGDGCWVWRGARSVAGYGRFKLVRGRKGIQVWAHRYSWRLANSEEPGELMVCHKCDNPPCVRPDHLFLGTNDDNRADMIAKWRHPRGSRHAQAVLTEDQVREIRQIRRETGESYSAIGNRFGVHVVTIADIITGKSWKHIWP